MTLGPIDDPSEFEPVAGIADAVGIQRIAGLAHGRRTCGLMRTMSSTHSIHRGKGGDVTTQDHMPR